MIELLVVIAIVCVLASLLLPALSAAMSRAKATACKNHLRNMGQALKMYVDDHLSRYPYYLGLPGDSHGDAGLHGRVYWSSQLVPYYPIHWSNLTFHCPGYRGVNWGPGYFAGAIERLGSYAYNYDGVRVGSPLPGHFGIGPVVFWKNVTAVSEAQIKVPSEMFTIGESRFYSADVNQCPGGLDYMICGQLKEPPRAFHVGRHGKNYNQLFCDGHVTGIDPWTLFNPTNTASMWNYDHQPHPELWMP